MPVGDALLGRVVNALGEPIDGKGPDRHGGDAAARGPGARHRPPPAGERAAADRHQGHRRHDPDRPGPARADHRRPQDGQDHRRRRHHPQPAGPGREVHLRRHRPEGLLGGPDGGHLRGPRRPGLHGGRAGRGRRPGAVQVPRPLRRLRHGHALDGQRRARPHRLRRPVQAGRGLPPAVAAAAPPAGPRGLPGRRLLPPQPAARACGQAVRRRGRRIAHRAPHHRDQGRRRLRLYPDQRDLDHRRPGVLGERALLLRGPPGHQRGHLGEPGGRARPRSRP